MAMEALQRALGYQRFSSLAFVLCGDFVQLTPVNGTTLYSAMLSGTTAVGLWLRQFKVVTLTQNMRCAPDDIKWRELLTRICDPTKQPFTDDVIKQLPVLQPGDVLSDPDLRTAQFATPDNATRATINRSQAIAHAKRLGVPILAWYLPVSKPSGTALRHPSVPLDLLVDPAVVRGVQEGEPCLLVLFFPGGRAVIVENQSVPKGVVNSKFHMHLSLHTAHSDTASS